MQHSFNMTLFINSPFTTPYIEKGQFTWAKTKTDIVVLFLYIEIWNIGGKTK